MATTTVLSGIANWARLVTPGRSFDDEDQWEVTLVVPRDVAEDWTAKGYQRTTKQDKDSNYIIKLKKPCRTATGKEQKPPKVRHVEGYILKDDIVGNGSKVKVQVALIPYTYKGKDGITPRINAVIVEDLIEYEDGGEGDFFNDLPEVPEVQFDEDYS